MINWLIVISVKEVLFEPMSACLLVRRITWQVFEWFSWNLVGLWTTAVGRTF